MEKQTRQPADIPRWSALLVEAVNKPGLIMKAYSAFHSYSLAVRCESARAFHRAAHNRNH